MIKRGVVSQQDTKDTTKEAAAFFDKAVAATRPVVHSSKSKPKADKLIR